MTLEQAAVTKASGNSVIEFEETENTDNFPKITKSVRFAK